MAAPRRYDGLEVPAHGEAETDFDHADLEFYGVDHSGHSFEVRVYLNNPDAGVETGYDEAQGYVDSFYIFGHGGCYGEEGHCDPTRRTPHPFDYRLPHPLEPMTKSVEITHALKRLRAKGDGELSVTLVPVVTSDDVPLGSEAKDELGIDSVSLITYETALAEHDDGG